jgi:hypothetical protein
MASFIFRVFLTEKECGWPSKQAQLRKKNNFSKCNKKRNLACALFEVNGKTEK